MPKLFSSLRECLGFSQIIKSAFSIISIDLLDISSKLPIGVATMYNPKSIFFICILIIFISSCSPQNSSFENDKKNQPEVLLNNKDFKKEEKPAKIQDQKINIETNEEAINDIKLDNTITVLFPKNDKKNITLQFVNVLELAVFEKGLKNVKLEIEYFDNNIEFEKIIMSNIGKGKIYIGPLSSKYTNIAKNYCNKEAIFFSFSSDRKIANDCIFLLNFFPKNELEQLFEYLDGESKVALLYPENQYGYLINGLIDEIINNSNAILINRASYKSNLSNVRSAIKELGKYELRKYELKRQKQILLTKDDDRSKKRLKKLEKFKTTNDYDFTHILIADYGLNLLQVAPLLPFYDIDPKIVQFISTGVIDDDNFFTEPSLQGTIFPGVDKSKRLDLVEKYQETYNDKFIRISTLPYDLIGLINFVFSSDLSVDETFALLKSQNIKFDGVDGSFYFKENIIERELDILKISNGTTKKIN